MNIRHLFVFVSLAALPAAIGQTGASDTMLKTPDINFQVLKSWKVELSDHSIFLNRVVPPILPRAPEPALKKAEPVMTPEQREILQKRAAKKTVTLFLSATVYDRQISELSWLDEHGLYRAFSNIDFNYVPVIGGFETSEASYTLVTAVRNETRAERMQYLRSLAEKDLPSSLSLAVPPPATDFNPTRSTYMVFQDKTQPPSPVEVLAALDALHVYFDGNKQALIEEHEKRKAANAELQRRLKEHPPKPKNTVINYWIGNGATRTLDKRSIKGRP